MPYMALGRSQIYYEDHGRGLPVVLAHGVGGNHASWFNQVPTLSRAFRTITFDHRGFGNSTDAEGFGRAAFAEDIGRLLDALDIGRAVLVGQSMGGGSTAAFTCLWPDRVLALVQCDAVTAAALAEPQAGEMARVNAANARLPQPERVLGRTTLAGDPERTMLYLQLASFNAVNMQTLTGALPRWSYDDLAATEVPVMFIVGKEDVLCPPRIVRALHEGMAGSRYAEIAGAGHSAYFERPDAFNRVLVDFLQSLGLT